MEENFNNLEIEENINKQPIIKEYIKQPIIIKKTKKDCDLLLKEYLYCKRKINDPWINKDYIKLISKVYAKYCLDDW